MQPDIDKFFRILKETKEPAYDVETDGLDWKSNKLVGYSVSDGKDAVYIPVRHSGGGNISDVNNFERVLSSVIQGHKGRIVGHNIKFDMHFSENQGIKLHTVSDTMARDCLCDENQYSYSLENTAKRYNIEPKKGKVLYEHIARKFDVSANRNAMGHFHRLSGDDPIAVEYAAGDTITTKQLYDAQAKTIYREHLDVVAGVEDEITYVLQKMERRGVRIDEEEADRVRRRVSNLQFDAETAIGMRFDQDDMLAKPFNVRSKNDLKEYFEHCELDDWPMTAPTKTFPNGQPSFNKDFLMGSEEGLLILNVRKYATLKANFLNPLDDFVKNGRIHCTFNQTRGETHGTRSGRLSCSDPNLQQVPKRDYELGTIYRRIFVPDSDCVFVEFDYSQAEPRLYTHYSNEDILIKGYNTTPYVDMHSIASQYMNISRDDAKHLNLGIMYGMGAAKLARKLGVSYEAALEILKRWKRTFTNVDSFTRIASRKAEERGYVHTLLGRRSRFDNPKFSYRAANRIIQGGCADILKYKMVEIDRFLRDGDLEDVCKMVLTIHDAVAFLVHKDYLHLIHEIKGILERVSNPPFSLKVPFVAEYKTGSNWAEATYGKAA